MIFFLSSAFLPGRAVGLSDQIEMNGEYLTNFIAIHRCQYLEEKFFGKKRSMDLKRVHSMLSRFQLNVFHSQKFLFWLIS